MGLQDTPRASRLHIGLFGNRNAGKSSLINALTGQDISLVSPVAGTTTDPVYKAFELRGVGPVVFIDTAGLDDAGELGALRVQKTKEALEKTDVAILVLTGRANEELAWYRQFREKKLPVLAVLNQCDQYDTPEDISAVLAELSIQLGGLPVLPVSAQTGENIPQLRQALVQCIPDDFWANSITGDLAQAGDTVLLVMPQDIQAPKGRLILPQVQVTRDLLDRGCRVLSVLPDGIRPMLDALKVLPDLVITDSQVFPLVNEILPKEVRLTSFSVLLSENKGDIRSFLEGARAIDRLVPGDRVLIMESCTHHPLAGDIARQKLPAWLEKHVGGALRTEVFSGPGFPADIREYKLILHCGGCMLNRKNLLSKISEAQKYGVPMTNFGIAIAHINGMLDRICW